MGLVKSKKYGPGSCDGIYLHRFNCTSHIDSREAVSCSSRRQTVVTVWMTFKCQYTCLRMLQHEQSPAKSLLALPEVQGGQSGQCNSMAYKLAHMPC